MMKMKNIGKILILAVASQAILSSCDDFLTIEPQDRIVLEKYWKEEKDVESVLAACYAHLESRDCLDRMVVWGELRSDNMAAGTASGDLLQVTKENILETNQYTRWQCFYQVINECNTVLYYAPKVNEIDPNFSDSELRATEAEAITLRSLCYFYLMRAFRDVPYVTNPSKDDTQSFQVAATPFDEMLDHLIEDMEHVKDDAVRSYGEKHSASDVVVENSCRITRWACYALLADLYLWKGDWAQCIYYCDLVIAEKIRQYEEDYAKYPTTLTTELYGKYPLIREVKAGKAGNAYKEIFGEGNSFESIFELVFVDQQTTTNATVANFYGSEGSSAGQISVPEYTARDPFNDGADALFKKTDCRYLENIRESSNKYYVTKYVNQEVAFNTSESTKPTVSQRRRSANYANWIIYRLTDVMLMRAEALVEQAGDVPEGENPTEEQLEAYRDAFDTVMAVWRRANNKRTATTDVPNFEDYAISRRNMEDFVFDERQRELMFEGKRWFDLVRLSLRDGENDRMVKKVLPKFVENANAIGLKLSTEDILFWPYHRDELKQNTKLNQNAAYVTDNTQLNF